MNRVALCGEGGFVDHFRHRRMRMDGRVDVVDGKLLIEGETHLCDELGGVVTDDVRA